MPALDGVDHLFNLEVPPPTGVGRTPHLVLGRRRVAVMALGSNMWLGLNGKRFHDWPTMQCKSGVFWETRVTCLELWNGPRLIPTHPPRPRYAVVDQLMRNQKPTAQRAIF